MDIIKQTKDWCDSNNAELIYLVKFGSHLYGTSSPESDTDYKGIYLPSKRTCFLNKVKKSFTYSTDNSKGRNTSEDVDIQLWSLQYFLKLVSSGETNALDLLYSHTYPEMMVYTTSNMWKLFSNHQHLFSTTDCNAYTGYAISQAKKYGIKGSRLGIIKHIADFLKSVPKESDSDKLEAVVVPLLEKNQDPSYCFTKVVNEVPALVVCGKVHLLNITIKEFKDRIFREYDRYGERAKKAEKSEGVDWKALSHAMRALYQMKELLTTGKIQYPLDTAEALKKIKMGMYEYPRVERLIVQGLKEVDFLLATIDNPLNIKNQKLIDDIIISFYENEY